MQAEPPFTVPCMAAKIRVRHAVPLWQRLRRRWRSWRGAALGKTHVVHFVDIGEARYKRVVFAELETAQAVVAALQALGGTGCVPALARHQDCEVWVDYVPGPPPKPSDPTHQACLIDFFRRLYAVGGTLIDDPAPFIARLHSDLDFLVEAGVLTRERGARLKELEQRLRPPSVRVGLDYIDPLAKNFVVADEGLVAIDIEALVSDAILGTGLAKARLRWPFDPCPAVCGRLADGGGPDLSVQLPWAELCFLCEYFRQKLLQGKPGHVRLGALDRLLRHQTAETPH